LSIQPYLGEDELTRIIREFIGFQAAIDVRHG
jgi:hypothetical protein